MPYVIPKEGLKIPDPEMGDLLPTEGRNVPDSDYWHRLALHEDVSVVQQVITTITDEGAN